MIRSIVTPKIIQDFLFYFPNLPPRHAKPRLYLFQTFGCSVFQAKPCFYYLLLIFVQGMFNDAQDLFTGKQLNQSLQKPVNRRIARSNYTSTTAAGLKAGFSSRPSYPKGLHTTRVRPIM